MIPLTSSLTIIALPRLNIFEAYSATIAQKNQELHSLDLNEVVATIIPDNISSIRLAEKFGMIFWKSYIWGWRTSYGLFHIVREVGARLGNGLVMRNIYVTILLFMTVAVLIATFACGDEEEPCFGIYLVDSEELVSSEYHIKAYRRGVHFYEDDTDTNVIEMNKEGIEKWNSYIIYETNTDLEDSLYYRDFILKIEREEIYRGRFYSMVSSMIYEGVVILDALIKLDDDHNYIRIDWDYPTLGFAIGKDPRNNPEVIDCFEKSRLFK